MIINYNFKENFFFQISLIALFAGILAATYFIYYQALQGPFLLDDYVNIDRLKLYAQSTSPYPWLEYILKGTSILDRPLSRLTFLIDDNAWPSEPGNFKRTNLLLHLLTGLAILRFLIAVGKGLEVDNRSSYLIATLAASYWIIHPLQVSTAMYVVQRMAQLSTLFTIAGLTLYIEARLLRAHSFRSTGLLALSGLSFILGFLSKENAAAAPLVIGALEITIFSGKHRTPYQNQLRYAFFFAPTLLLLVGIIHSWEAMTASYSMRDFNLYERLLTQLRVLVDYLQILLFPTLNGTGIFHDDWTISRNPISPLSTLFCGALITIILAMSVHLRYKFRSLSFGILFFFSCHFIESTFVPLEIYFEHRNYLPSVGIFYLIFYYLIALLKSDIAKHQGARIVIYVAISTLLVSAAEITNRRTYIWSSLDLVYEHAAKHHHESERLARHILHALTTMGNVYNISEAHEKASEIVHSLLEKNPSKTSLIIETITLQCLAGKEIHSKNEAMIQRIKESQGDIWAARSFTKMLGVAKRKFCRFPKEFQESIFIALANNPNIRWNNESWAIFYRNWGGFAQGQSLLDEAIGHYKKAWTFAREDERLAHQLAILTLANKNEREATTYARFALTLHEEKGISSLLPPSSADQLKRLIAGARTVNSDVSILRD